MASGLTQAAKRSRIVGEAPSVRKQGKELSIPWEDISPAHICQWLDTFSKANNTTQDILLASILPTVACLMGPSTTKVDCRIRAETVNLFIICLCDPRAGRSPAFQHGCDQPIRLHVETKEDNALFVDEFTKAGLFRQLKAANGHKAIVSKEEASQFFEQILGSLREKSRIDMEHMIQLFDGSTWVYTKGDKCAHQVIDSPGLSLSGYSQPNRFFPIYVKLKERRDGAADRMLIYQRLPHRLAARETREYIRKPNKSPVKDLTYFLGLSSVYIKLILNIAEADVVVDLFHWSIGYNLSKHFLPCQYR